MRVHVDADLLVYRCGFAAEKGEYTLTYGNGIQEVYTYKKDVTKRLEVLGNPVHTLEFARRPEPVENALHNVNTVIAAIKEELQSDDLGVYLSGDSNFRDGIATIRPYKGNRKDNHKPIHMEAIKDLLRNKYKAVVSDNEEADDVIGYSHYAMWTSDRDSTCICSTDKDLDMLPGLHYNFVKKELYSISPEDAIRNFYYQLLVGDAVDNIQGIGGVGQKTAREILKAHDTGDIVPTIRELYLEHYGNEGEVALQEHIDLLWIRREPNQRMTVDALY